MLDCARKALVGSARGPGGGYRLSREAEKINIIDVITAVDENMDATRCGGLKNCQGNQRCLTHELWEDLSRQIYKFLARITLGELVQRGDIKEAATRLDNATSVGSGDRAVPVIIANTNLVS